jgi:two-component system nitrogen regulation sensor histidine kinase NtrY
MLLRRISLLPSVFIVSGAGLAFAPPFWYSALTMATEGKEAQSGVKTVLFLFGFLVLTALAIVLEIKYRGFEGPFSDYLLISILIIANFLLLAAVIFMIARSLWKLSEERKKGVHGARFRTKLVAAFVSLSFIPPVLLFLIGSGMFTRSIERLFSLKIESSLQDSVSLAQAYYDRLREQGYDFGRKISRRMTEENLLHEGNPRKLKEFVQSKAAEYGLGAVELFLSPKQRPVVVVTSKFPARTFRWSSADLAKIGFTGQYASVIEELGKQGEIVRSVVPVFAVAGARQVTAVVVVSYYIPKSLAAKANGIRSGYEQYRSSLSGKEPIKLSYRLGFLAVTLALLLAAIWVALRVAAGITVPISKLVEGTSAVAAGRLDYQITEKTGDEVGMLIDSFNRMTRDLRQSREQLEQEVSYKQTILSNVETGVLSMDRTRRITMINRAACEILGVQEQDVLHKRYDEAFSFLQLDQIRQLFRKLEEGHGRTEEEITVAVRGRLLTLRTRVSTLRDGAGSPIGSVITFDDLTELIRAKKAETWQDVARRIAHEFKNPLTPIKLSAERLRKKHSEGSTDFDRIFDECSRTIVQEADGLRKLVDEFANFARMPGSNPIPQPLAPVIESAAQLYASAHKDIVLIRQLDAAMPDVVLDAEQMKRVFINLLENAVEAMRGKGCIRISSQLTSFGTVQIEIADDGPGIKTEDMPKLFQPDFSRKKKKSGLGLAIVLRIIKDHNGTIRVEQNQPRGARFVIELPVKQV